MDHLIFNFLMCTFAHNEVVFCNFGNLWALL